MADFQCSWCRRSFRLKDGHFCFLQGKPDNEYSESFLDELENLADKLERAIRNKNCASDDVGNSNLETSSLKLSHLGSKSATQMSIKGNLYKSTAPKPTDHGKIKKVSTVVTQTDDSSSIGTDTNIESLDCIADAESVSVAASSGIQNQCGRTGKRKRYLCVECGKEFGKKSHLDRHRRIHTGEKPFVCNACNKKFNNEGNLKKHLMIHTGEKPFVCEICSKAFSQKTQLQEHLHTHTREKPFACECCDELFSNRSTLRKHCLTHTGEKPYTCHVCSQTFSQISNLKVHIRIHTGEKPHSCPICSKAFRQLNHLKAHIRTHKP